MKPPAASRQPPAAAALAMLFLCASAPGQVMTDPTRPPTGQAGAEADAGGAEAGAPVLQSVMISPALKAAIINGTMVKLGEKYGDAVLVKIAENEVVLKSGSDTQVLKLYPGVEKREVASGAAKSTARRSKPRRTESESAAPGAPAAQ